MYHKTDGIVTGYFGRSTISYNSAKRATTTSAVVPTIKYTIDGVTYEESDRKWAGFCLPELGEKVTLLYGEDHESPELNRFLQYWLTFGQIVATLLISALLLMITETIRDYKIKKS